MLIRSLASLTTTLLGGGACRRISWPAIFGGVILVVAVQFLLSMLGAGIGLGTVNVNVGSTPDASSFGIGAGIWWVVSSVIALVHRFRETNRVPRIHFYRHGL